MSKFSEKCKELLTENGYNVYRLSQAASLERTTLQRMVTGKRLPGPEFVEHFCQALRISLPEKKEIMELYKMEAIGETAYRNQTTILHLFEKLSALEKNEGFNKRSIVDYGEMKLISPISNDKYETELLLQYVLRKTIQEQESPELYTNLPGTDTLLPHYLNLMIPQYGKAILIKHLIHFQTNASYAYENLETTRLFRYVFQPALITYLFIIIVSFPEMIGQIFYIRSILLRKNMYCNWHPIFQKESFIRIPRFYRNIQKNFRIVWSIRPHYYSKVKILMKRSNFI